MIISLLLAATVSVAAPAKSAPKPTFSATLAAFQKDRSDANREAVIAAARSAKPKPAAPEEAERFEGRAEFAFKNAKSAADFVLAAQEYRKAVDAAPWLAANYFNLGVAQEKSGDYVGAKKSFEWYLKAAPGAEDAKEVRKRVAGLELGIEQANNPKARAEKVLALYKEKYGGPVLSYSECGVRLNEHWYCTAAQDTPGNTSVVPFEAWRTPNPVKWSIVDAEKGVIKFDPNNMVDACGDVRGDTMESVVWRHCAGTTSPGDSHRFYTDGAGRPAFRWNFSCGSARYGADACRRMTLVFQ